MGRPDSGEGVETLPQLLTVLSTALKEHWQEDLAPLVPVFPAEDPYAAKYEAVLHKIRAKVGVEGNANPFRRFKGQQMRILQGDGVALDTVGDMLASLLANGFCSNTVNFGSGGGLLQKLNRDSLAVAFKCCAMYVGGKTYPVGKDPIAGGKKSYGGNPPVIRDARGVLRNRGEYDANGNMIRGLPMTYEEFMKGVPGDDLALKVDFFQQMTTEEAIAIRLAEAACGSKWKHAHASHLPAIKESFPQHAATFEKLGITDSMSSTEVLEHIKANYVCEKKAQKKVFRKLGDDEPQAAIAAMAGKHVITM